MEDQVKIKRLQGGDLKVFIELIKLFEEVFEMENFTIPNDRYLQALLNREDFDVFVAINNKDLVIGGLTTYLLAQYYSEKPLAYIFDLAVDRNHQRQGTGKKLIEAVQKFYDVKGSEEMFVQVDKVDEHAIEFYRKTIPSAERQVVHFSYSFKRQDDKI